MDQCLVVLCSCPASHSEKLATYLVEGRLAACVNGIAGVTSVYRWQNEIQQDLETLLIIKTTQSNYSQLETAIKTQHPYDVPEIIVLPIVQGSENYLTWLKQSLCA